LHFSNSDQIKKKSQNKQHSNTRRKAFARLLVVLSLLVLCWFVVVEVKKMRRKATVTQIRTKHCGVRVRVVCA
jgi:hypothetical protein